MIPPTDEPGNGPNEFKMCEQCQYSYRRMHLTNGLLASLREAIQCIVLSTKGRELCQRCVEEDR